jgi:signal transduction histidine kinase
MRSEREARKKRAEAHAARAAFNQAEAVNAERARIYADLHDDLGAKLLQLVYEAPNPQMANLARTCIQDLRDVVSRSRGCAGTLSQTLTEIEIEARSRLKSAQIDLDWQVKAIAIDAQLSQGQVLHLFRIVREALSNAIKHAQAHALKIRVQGTPLSVDFDISDDGIGLHANTHQAPSSQRGSGMLNMRERAEKIAGNITWRAASIGGTRVLLRMPLQEPQS